MSKARKLLPFLIGAIIIAFLIAYIKKNADDFSQIKEVRWDDTVFLALSTLLYILAQGLVLKSSVSFFNVKLRPIEWLGVVPVAMMSNYILPASGVLFSVSYLKRVHNLSYSNYASALSASYISEFFVFALGGLVGLLYMQNALGTEAPGLTIFFAILSFIFALCLVCKIPFPNSSNKILHRINILAESWEKIRKEKSLVSKLVLYNLLQLSANALMFYFAYRAFHWNIPVLANFLVASISNFSLFIRLAPASLGTYDATILYASSLYGLNISQGITVALLVRIVTTFCLFTLGPLFSLVLMKRPAINSDDSTIP